LDRFTVSSFQEAEEGDGNSEDINDAATTSEANHEEISDAAMTSAIKFVDLCVQQTAFIAGRSDISQDIAVIKSSKFIQHCHYH
jgi:hypothetical protein